MNTNTETQTINATQTESGEKLFTQEQVNQIVSERLARERSKAATEQATTDREKALDAREQALNAVSLWQAIRDTLPSCWTCWTLPALIASKHRRTSCWKRSPTWATLSRSRVQTLRPHRSLKANRTKTS